DPTVAEAVAASGAKILLVAMGIPRQEEWIVRNEKLLGGVLAVGVGGAFDVLSGRLKRSPEFLQKIGLEWLYRLLQEPGRWKKNLGLITFVLRVLATRASFYVWKGEER
ncbi:MAG: WecB/TagA/CpsF family glycosyltransferase, partial [Fretibacterium sp.]|nr:WecB/TagA/CpsF family glycosyltransferase [Fretibacterium sp.]